MYEVARETDENFEGDENGLCDLLKELATDSDKHKAKKDLRQQRSSFRDVMRAIEVILYFMFHKFVNMLLPPLWCFLLPIKACLHKKCLPHPTKAASFVAILLHCVIILQMHSDFANTCNQ